MMSAGMDWLYIKDFVYNFTLEYEICYSYSYKVLWQDLPIANLGHIRPKQRRAEPDSRVIPSKSQGVSEFGPNYKMLFA